MNRLIALAACGMLGVVSPALARPDCGSGLRISIGTGFYYGSGYGYGARYGSYCAPTRLYSSPHAIYVPARPIVYSTWHTPTYDRCATPVVRHPANCRKSCCVRVVRPVVRRQVCTTDAIYAPATAGVITYAADRPVTVIRAEAPPPITHVTEEEWAWRSLARGDDDAMERFSRLVARGKGGAVAELGYAVCAAAAGQPDRAEWAARQALAQDPKVIAKAPQVPGLREAVADALRRYEADTESARGTPGRAETVAVLKAVAGDDAGAARAAQAALKLGSHSAAVARLADPAREPVLAAK